MMKSHDDHPPALRDRAFVVGIALNLGFVAVEAVMGWKSGSLALLADAGHNLSDVAGLALAWAAVGAARLRPDMRHTYGWRRGSILASFVSALMLLTAMGALAWEAAHRFSSPSPVNGMTVMVVAAIGVVINAVTAWLFHEGSHRDLNIRGAFMHMAADALVSVGVLVAGALVWWRGWFWIDPVISLLIALVIVVGTWSLFRQSLHLLFDGVPEGIDIMAIQEALIRLDGAVGVHDLHVWSMSTTADALTVHLVCEEGRRDAVLEAASQLLRRQFGIRHASIQTESREYAATCAANVRDCAA